MPGAPEPEQPQITAHGETEDDERARIVRVLRETRGIIAGPTGAAARLGLKRTTLNSRIRKLGITRDELWA